MLMCQFQWAQETLFLETEHATLYKSDNTTDIFLY